MLIKNLFRYWTYQVFSPGIVLREKYESFKALLEYDKAAHEFMADLEEFYYNQKKHDFQAVVKTYGQLACSVSGMVDELLKMCPARHWNLKDYFKKFDFYVRFMLAPPEFDFSPPFTIDFRGASLLNESIAGKKAYSLSVLNQRLHLPIPNGFVITTNAFYYFLEYSGLQKLINEQLANLDISSPDSLEQTAFEIEQLILAAPVPEEIEAKISDTLNSCDRNNTDGFRVALRSSAVKEDGRASFAGQYRTLLNVNKKDVLTGYKKVIAGKYSARALFYRINLGILDDETPMAVMVLEMVNSKASGVIYTKDTEHPNSGNLLIHSILGQGEQLVDGKISPDVIPISRKNPTTVLGTKTETPEKLINQESKNRNSIDDSVALTLARWGLMLEKHFGQPQDIEWCQDKTGRVFILQSRPLNIQSESQSQTIEPFKVIENHLLCSGGETVSHGIASGRVFILDDPARLSQIPEGSVLVVKHALPGFVKVIHQMNAIIIETGSRASHFASIAREFQIPAIANIKNGFQHLAQGDQVTVDAVNCRVYKGVIDSFIPKSPLKKELCEESAFMVKLRYVINFSTRLKLTDPGSPSFTPEGCRSLHDIIRFAHETAVKEMFLMGGRKGSRKKGAKKLVSSIPMLFYILDVGDGINKNQHNKKTITPEDIVSVPMKSVLKGLSNPGICWSETTHFDWEEYDKIAMAGGIISADSPQFGSYAVVSGDYLNVNLRFGYHFVILDTICSDSPEDNYILFRFSGGGGSPDGRTLRASFIKGILTRLGFMVEVKSDLVDAEFKNGSLTTMKKTLDITGRLLGASKLMDMYIGGTPDIEFLVEEFMKGRYDFRSGLEKK